MYNRVACDASPLCPQAGGFVQPVEGFLERRHVAMHLILTHEQADFDALAASLGASLLHPQAVPVLPRRINRNVRAYLTLYGERLPFVTFEDLGGEPVDRVTLVDTQNLTSVKGLKDDAQVDVIDHHTLDNSLDPAWEARIETVGASATLLVEALREAPVDLDWVAATMLLLGIYEDTGSLSYTITTSRDLVASAWLLEVGANLNIASDFLNHPLSAEQRDLYEQLLEVAETHQFHGVSVVLAAAQSEGMVDEISTLAHKLRDLFDPAGLFVLVALDGHIQLVARSTSDAVNVAKVAEQFGGGGHERAAAALIREGDLASVRRKLLEMLPSLVIPPTTVGEIMSRGPQLLAPDSKIEDAAQKMQRFGHEGYPVIENGTVVGLLTRRAVDRAMAHRLGDRPVSSVMDAGEVSVHPNDSIEQLQRVMIRHDWGQVPVIDPEKGDIVGIVTRTDLLTTLAADLEEAGPPNLSDRLEAALPASRLALLKLVAGEAEAAQIALYVVGGFVRDLLLEMPSVDFDLVVEGDAIELGEALAEAYGGRVSSHRRFGTAKWVIDRDSSALKAAIGSGGASLDDLPESLDLVGARTEFYPHPTALPRVARGSIKLDLHRRDFTINTLALRLDGTRYGQLQDYWGGGSDLKSGLIRVLHSLSFVDDPTRMLRAVRLEQRLGFHIEERTLELLKHATPLLDRVSGDRIRSELGLIFAEAERGAIMQQLDALGLLEAIHPALAWDEVVEARWDQLSQFTLPSEWGLTDQLALEPQFFALWLYDLSAPQAQAALDRLHVPGWMAREILEAIRVGQGLQELPKQAKPSQVAFVQEDAPEASLITVWLASADRPWMREWVDRYLTRWRHVRPHADGHHLRQLGLPPGPAYRDILNSLRAGWLDGDIESQAGEEKALQALLDEVRDLG
jgi:tRNA nucleotidyltransferase (CCA-adding enzyme)